MGIKWLVNKETENVIKGYTARKQAVTPEEREIFLSKQDSLAKKATKELEIVKGTAIIKVEGVLLPEPDRWLDYWEVSYTSYAGLIKELSEAEVSNKVNDVQLWVNSGGGAVEGIIDVLKVLKDYSKPIISLNYGQMDSGGYFIPAMTDKIYAINELSEFGSIGVAYDALWNESRISITNRDSEAKRPDLGTDEGKDIVRDELDEIYNVFLPLLAEGRGVSVDEIKKNYGAGRVYLAEKAIKIGMADGYYEDIQVNNQKGVVKMTLEELKVQHPDLYEQVKRSGHDEGFEAGKKAYKEDVEAHLECATSPGATKKVIENIKAGKPFGPATMAAYMQENMQFNLGKSTEEDQEPEYNGSGASKKKVVVAGVEKGDAFDKTMQYIAADDETESMGIFDLDDLEDE